MNSKKIAILGTVGVPANYGGFETLAENLVQYHHVQRLPSALTVYCCSHAYKNRDPKYYTAELKFIPLNANGIQSIPYDFYGLMSAVWHRYDVILQLGVSGAIVLPLVRLLSPARVITNIDGIEWKRDKWNPFAKWFLRTSEKVAVCFSHEVIADNQAIADYVWETYGVNAHVIAYGGDHAVETSSASVEDLTLPDRYAFSVCRIEPENNIHMILEAFSLQKELPLVIVGNWKSSEYGKELLAKYKMQSHLFLIDPIYDIGKLKALRSNATIYVHGHSAGGTNPSLVEAMHFAKPILAYDCTFNRFTTEDKAIYFNSSEDLLCKILQPIDFKIGEVMLQIAKRRYTWNVIAREYFELFSNES